MDLFHLKHDAGNPNGNSNSNGKLYSFAADNRCLLAEIQQNENVVVVERLYYFTDLSINITGNTYLRAKKIVSMYSNVIVLIQSAEFSSSYFHSNVWYGLHLFRYHLNIAAHRLTRVKHFNFW